MKNPCPSRRDHPRGGARTLGIDGHRGGEGARRCAANPLQSAQRECVSDRGDGAAHREGVRSQRWITSCACSSPTTWPRPAGKSSALKVKRYRKRPQRPPRGLTPAVRLAALGQDLRDDGEHDLAFLVAGLDVGGDDAAVGPRLEVDLLRESAAILERVADVGGLHPGQISESRRRPVGSEADALGARSLVAGEPRADVAARGVGRRVPARRAQAAEQRGLRRRLVEVEGLRIELARKGDDLVPAEGVRAEVGQLAELAILEEEVGARRAGGCRVRPTGWRWARAASSAPRRPARGLDDAGATSWLVRQLAATSPF